MKELRKVYDRNTQYRANVRTRIVTKVVDGETVYCEGAEAERVLRMADRRVAAGAARREFDSTMRDLGMTKVRGAATGRTYWE